MACIKCHIQKHKDYIAQNGLRHFEILNKDLVTVDIYAVTEKIRLEQVLNHPEKYDCIGHYEAGKKVCTCANATTVDMKDA
jgi:hypothetical protein